MTLDELRSLPPTLDVERAASLLACGRTAAYEAIRAGTWPTPVVRVGRRIRIPTAALLRLLGIEPLTGAAPVGGRGDMDTLGEEVSRGP